MYIINFFNPIFNYPFEFINFEAIHFALNWISYYYYYYYIVQRMLTKSLNWCLVAARYFSFLKFVLQFLDTSGNSKFSKRKVFWLKLVTLLSHLDSCQNYFWKKVNFSLLNNGWWFTIRTFTFKKCHKTRNFHASKLENRLQKHLHLFFYSQYIFWIQGLGTKCIPLEFR